MCKQMRLSSALRIAFTFVLCFTASARGQDAPRSAGHNMSDMHFTSVPGLPTCSTGSVQHGDPAKGPSIILAKLTAGCMIPWHWHTPNEHLMMVAGIGRAEMKDGKSITLRAGGFALMPSRHVHQFLCEKACEFYVYSDATFDMHYVDGKGQDVSPDEALKAVKETAAKPPK